MSRTSEFGIRDKNGRITDYDLWTHLLDEDELPDRALTKSVKFDANQPRDTHGRWSAHGGVTWSQPLGNDGRPIPIKVSTVDAAIDLVLAGKVVEVQDVRTVHTVLTKLAAMAEDAKAKGKDAPKYDLCQVAVRGSNLFCGQALRSDRYPQGRPRLSMPQLSGVPEAGTAAAELPVNGKGKVNGAKAFIAHMRELGIPVEKEKVRASSLRASQAQLDGPKVAEMMTREHLKNKRIFITRDNYIVDGHHHWAANVGLDAADGHLGDIRMKAWRIDAPVSEVLLLANVWTKKFGIQPVKGIRA